MINPVVAPSIKTPAVYISVNLKAGTVAPGSAPRRVLLVASKNTSGTITADTQLVEGVGADDVKTYLGARAPGALAALRLFEEYRNARVDLIAPAVNGGGVAASGAINFADGPPTSAITVRAWIAGRLIEVVWATGETNQQGATKLANEISKITNDDIPVTAAAAINGAGPTYDCNLTFALKGPIGNDCTVYTQQVGGAGGTIAAPGSNKLTSGAGEPNYTTAIGAIAGKKYDLILNCCSNADAQLGSSSSNPGRVKVDIDLRMTGASAKLQQQVVGLTGALSAAKTGAGAMNDEESQYVFCLNGQSLPCEWSAAEAGARTREESLKPNKNRIGMAYRARLFGPYNMATDIPDDIEVEDALNTGITIVSFTSDGTAYPTRPITSYFKDSGGNPDDRVLDVGIPTGMFAVVDDIRLFLQQEYPQKNLSPDLEPGDDPPPPDTVEVREVLSAVDQRMKFWIGKGVARRDKWEAAKTAGTFTGQVNPSDPTQLDLVFPTSIVPPLAKIGVDARHFRT